MSIIISPTLGWVKVVASLLVLFGDEWLIGATSMIKWRKKMTEP
jgi:hypothetical protein